jgi:hypothetical protein
MALIDTGKGQAYLDTIGDLVQRLRENLIEELAAINTYDGMVRAVELMGWNPVQIDPALAVPPMPEGRLSADDTKVIAGIFAKLRDDEITHSGVLLDLMQQLDKNVAAKMSKGIEGV